METQQPESTLISHAVKTGVILGVATIILSALLYVIDESVMVHWAYGLLILIASIIFVVVRGIGYRKSRGGFLGFGDAWKHGFISFAVSAVLGTLFSFVLYTVIDPDLGDRLTEVSVENAMNMASSFGAPEESLNQVEADTRERMADQFSAGGIMKGLGINLIVVAVIALITGLIVRKQEKVQDL